MLKIIFPTLSSSTLSITTLWILALLFTIELNEEVGKIVEQEFNWG